MVVGLTAKETRSKHEHMRNDLKFPDDDPRVIACAKAVERIGGYTKTGRLFGIKAQSIYNWRIVPEFRCLDVAMASGMSVHELRPDVFGVSKHRTTSKKSARQSHVYAQPARAAAEEMEPRAAHGGKGVTGKGRHRVRRRKGNGNRAKPSAGKNIPRPGPSVARLFAEAKAAEAAHPETAHSKNADSTSAAECGYGRPSW